MRISDWSSDVCSSDLENWRAQTPALPTCPRYHSAMALTLYGIPNCDTVKKARRWLDGAGVSHRFHDFRKDGLDPAKLQGWIDAIGWDRLPNQSGTTFRTLADPHKPALDTAKPTPLTLAP